MRFDRNNEDHMVGLGSVIIGLPTLIAFTIGCYSGAAFIEDLHMHPVPHTIATLFFAPLVGIACGYATHHMFAPIGRWVANMDENGNSRATGEYIVPRY